MSLKLVFSATCCGSRRERIIGFGGVIARWAPPVALHGDTASTADGPTLSGKKPHSIQQCIRITTPHKRQCAGGLSQVHTSRCLLVSFKTPIEDAYATISKVSCMYFNITNLVDQTSPPSVLSCMGKPANRSPVNVVRNESEGRCRYDDLLVYTLLCPTT